jgi:hypothetical protein
MAEERHFGKSLGAWLEAASDAIVSVFYPAGCRLCGRLLIHAIFRDFADAGLRHLRLSPDNTVCFDRGRRRCSAVKPAELWGSGRSRK